MPTPRMDTYLPPVSASTQDSGHTSAASRQGQIGLVLIQDVGAQDAAPKISANGATYLATRAVAYLEAALPGTAYRLVSVMESEAERTTPLPLRQIVERHGVDTAAVVLLSAVETAAPQPMALDGNRAGGGAMGRLPGTVTSVFALAEIAVVEVASGKRMLTASGRGHTELEQLARGMVSNAFPSIYREGTEQRIPAPEDDETAHDLVRSLAFDEALRQATVALGATRGR
ncbi:MAG: hypothetical protein U0172_14330 [Nitrospiraceae bacterium]